MPVTIECVREACRWFEEVDPLDQVIPYCPDCAPNRRVRTEVNHDFEDPEHTMSDKA